MAAADLAQTNTISLNSMSQTRTSSIYLTAVDPRSRAVQGRRSKKSLKAWMAEIISDKVEHREILLSVGHSPGRWACGRDGG